MATGSEEKSKEGCEGVKRKKKKAGDGVSPPEPGSPQPGSGSEKTGGREKEVVRWREDSGGARRITTSYYPLSPQAGPQPLMSEAPVYCNLVDLRRCPRSPPPSPACPPLQRLDAWEQHLDPNSGRCFYINPLTGCKSWKPPRRSRTRETNPGSMEGTQTLNRDNGVLQSQAEGSESDTGTPELLDPQVRSLPLPDHRQEKPSFHDLSFLGKTFFFIAPTPPPSCHPHPHPCSPTARDSQVSFLHLFFPITSPRVHPTSANAPPSSTPQTSLQPGRPLGLCRTSWTTPM